MFCSSNHSLFTRFTSIIIIISFLCQDVVFANPNLSYAHDTLQPKSFVPELKGEFRRTCEAREVEGSLTARDRSVIIDAVAGVTDPVVRDVAGSALGVKVPGEDIVGQAHAGVSKEAASAAVPQWLARKPENVKDVKESQEAYEYINPEQDFRGVDLEHFVHGQIRLKERLLADSERAIILTALGISEILTIDEQYKRIYEKLAEYNKKIVDLINGGTYNDPRLEREIDYQNRNAKVQGIFEAVSNGLDALGLDIGQFGKGIKQILTWLKTGNGGRIDVFSKQKGGKVYQLTIIRDEIGQNYIQIKAVGDKELETAAGQRLDNGTVIKVTVKEEIPLTEEDKDREHYISQSKIVEGIHKRFPYVTSVKITTRIGDGEIRKVNGFGSKRDITAAPSPLPLPPGERAREAKVRGGMRESLPVEEESSGRDVRVLVTDYSILIIDNGIGMDLEIISRMFTKLGTKHPEPLIWDKAPAGEKEKVKAVHDKELPCRISFARNGEVIEALDIPGDIIQDAVIEGGLMIECGAFMDVSESRDEIIIPLNLKPGEKSGFQHAVEYIAEKIIANPILTAVEKVKYINTITAGLDGLIKGNENYKTVIRQIRTEIKTKLKGTIEALKKEGYIILPYDRRYEKIAVPFGKKVLYVHEKLFDWRGAVSLTEIGAERIKGITLAGEKRIPLIIVPFKEEALRNVRRYNLEWHELEQIDRLPVIKTDTFTAIPSQFGERLKMLMDKKITGKLSEEDNNICNFLLQLIDIETAEVVKTSYEIGAARENLTAVPESEIIETEGRIDSHAVRNFLLLDGSKNIPQDANQRIVVLENGDLAEAGTGKRINWDAVKNGTPKEITAINNRYYKIKTTTCEILYNAKQSEVVWSGTSVSVSPDRKYVYSQNAEGNLNCMFSINESIILYCSSSFLLPNYSTHKIKFTKDGRYMTCLGIGDGEEANFNIFDLKNFKFTDIYEIPIHGKRLSEYLDIDYTFDKKSSSAFIHVGLKEGYGGPLALTDRIFVVNLADAKERKVEGLDYVNQIYTDFSGRLTFAIGTKNGRQKMRLLSYNGEYVENTRPIEAIEIVYDNNGDEHYIFYSGDEEYASVNDFLNSNSNGININDFRYIEFIIIEEGKSRAGFYKKDNTISSAIALNDIDPLQRRDRKGIYKQLIFNLIIDNSEPENPIAIDPRTGNKYPYHGEILDYTTGQSIIYIDNIGQLNSVGCGDEKNIVDLGICIAARSNIGPVFSDKIILKDQESNEYYLRINNKEDTMGDISGNLYTYVSFDGKYFIFVNPKTGDVFYLVPDTGNPIFVPANPIQEQPKEVVDRVSGLRNSFVTQIRAAYKPFLEAVPAEYKCRIEPVIKTAIEYLYKEQEKEIRKKNLNNIDVSDPLLPFNRFSRNMAQILPYLEACIEPLEKKLSQEDYAVKESVYKSLFTGLFAFCTTVDSVNDEYLRNGILLNVIAFGWVEDISAAPDINELIKVLTGEGIEIETISGVVKFLSGLASKDTNIVRKQLRKILNANPAVKVRFLREICKDIEEIKKSGFIIFMDVPVRIDKIFNGIEEPTGRGRESESRIKWVQISGNIKNYTAFFTNDCEQVNAKDRFVPDGEDIVLPSGGIALSQTALLEKNRKKDPNNPNDKIMDIDYLIDSINAHNGWEKRLPDISQDAESGLIKQKAESGAYAREIAQNSRDAAVDKTDGELVIAFYKQGAGGAEEYVEEASDNGTGALKETALLIDVSLKEEGGQKEFSGFFGTGKYAIFEGVDRVEIITRNAERAYMFTFTVYKDEKGNPTAIRLTGIRKVTDGRVRQGVTVRRIKLVSNTISELDMMLAKRAWKTFAGLSQRKNFKIYIMDSDDKENPPSPLPLPSGERTKVRGKPIMEDDEFNILTEADFKAVIEGEKKETNFGKIRIIETKDMPLQIVDKAGLRVCEICDKYLALIPASLRRHIRELGIVIQIPLPLNENRSSFKNETYYMPDIQKYIAIEFYKALVYKTLTSGKPQFVFENFPLNWETDGGYWDSIDLNDSGIIGLAEKINEGRYNEIDIKKELEPLLHESGKLDKEKKFLKLMLLLEVLAEPAKPRQGLPSARAAESLLGRRIAIVSEELAGKQIEILRAAGMRGELYKPDPHDIPDYARKRAQARSDAIFRKQMMHIENYIINEPAEEQKELLGFARAIAGNFGVEQVLLVREVQCTGAFIIYKDVRTMLLNISIIRHKDGITEMAYTIIHELAHFLEACIREDLWEKGFSAPNFTHDAVGVFAEAMKYAAAVTLANSGKGDSLPAAGGTAPAAAAQIKRGRKILSWRSPDEIKSNIRMRAFEYSKTKDIDLLKLLKKENEDGSEKDVEKKKADLEKAKEIILEDLNSQKVFMQKMHCQGALRKVNSKGKFFSHQELLYEAFAEFFAESGIEFNLSDFITRIEWDTMNSDQISETIRTRAFKYLLKQAPPVDLKRFLSGDKEDGTKKTEAERRDDLIKAKKIILKELNDYIVFTEKLRCGSAAKKTGKEKSKKPKDFKIALYNAFCGYFQNSGVVFNLGEFYESIKWNSLDEAGVISKVRSQAFKYLREERHIDIELLLSERHRDGVYKTFEDRGKDLKTAKDIILRELNNARTFIEGMKCRNALKKWFKKGPDFKAGSHQKALYTAFSKYFKAGEVKFREEEFTAVYKRPKDPNYANLRLNVLSALYLDNVTSGTNLSEIIRVVLGDTAPVKTKDMDLAEIMQMLKEEKRLISYDMLPVATPLGRIDLSRLNNKNRYYGENAVTELARDLGIAHYLGLIRIRNFIDSAALQPGIAGVLREPVPILSWSDIFWKEKKKTAGPAKGVWRGSYWLVSLLLPWETKFWRTMKEDLIVPLLEEGALLSVLYFGNIWIYALARIMFVVLHAFQDRSPPADKPRMLFEKTILPILISVFSFIPIILCLILSNPVSATAVFVSALSAHIIVNFLVTLSNSRLQKAVAGGGRKNDNGTRVVKPANFWNIVRGIQKANKRDRKPHGINLEEYPKKYGAYAVYFLIRDIYQNYAVEQKAISPQIAARRLNKIMRRRLYVNKGLPVDIFFKGLYLLLRAYRANKLYKYRKIAGYIRLAKELGKANLWELYSTFEDKNSINMAIREITGKGADIGDLEWEIINFPYKKVRKGAYKIMKNPNRYKGIAGHMRLAEELGRVNLVQLYSAFGKKEKMNEVIGAITGRKANIEDLGWEYINLSYRSFVDYFSISGTTNDGIENLLPLSMRDIKKLISGVSDMEKITKILRKRGYSRKVIKAVGYCIKVSKSKEPQISVRAEAVFSAAANIGKGVEFKAAGENKLEITLPGGEKIVVPVTEREIARERINRISGLAGKLKVNEVFPEFNDTISNFEAVKVFTGTPETHKAKAFAHMALDGTLYIDELFADNDMAIIHELLHLYLRGQDIKELVKNIPSPLTSPRRGEEQAEWLGDFIKEKAELAAGSKSGDKYEEYLRHYYARYYLQNPKKEKEEEKKYEGSENEELTKEIKINIIANELAVSVDVLKSLLSDLGEDDAVLRTKFLKMIKKDGEIEAGEVEVLVKNIEKVKGVLDRLAGLVNNTEKKEAIKRVALYLSIRDVARMNEVNELPMCMQKLAGQLVSLKMIADEKTAEKLMHDMMKKDFYVADADLRRMEEAGLNGEVIRVVREYLFLRVQIGKLLEVNVKDIEAVTSATNIAKIMQGYLKDKENKGRVVEVLARYMLGGEDRDLLKISEGLENSIQRIIRAKQIVEDTAVPVEVVGEPSGRIDFGLEDVRMDGVDRSA